MQRIIFEYSPLYFVVCLLVGIGYAWLLYSSKYSWPRNLNRALFALRTILATALAILLLGPILKHTENIFEKPSYVVLIDNSRSVKESTDTAQVISRLQALAAELKKQEREIEWSVLTGPSENIKF